MLARRAFNDPIGFLTGWALLLDYTIVIALAALFTPHYFGHAVGWLRLTRHPWDVVAAVFIVLAITLLRLVRRPGLYRIAIVVAAVAFVTDVVLIVLGFAFLFSPSDLGHGAHPGDAPTWHALAFALPVAMLAYTGLETVANLAQEAREPGKNMPRSLFVGLGAAVVVSALIGIVGVAAFPALTARTGSDRSRGAVDPGAAGRDRLGLQRAHAGAARRRAARDGRPRRARGSSLAAATTSISGHRPRRLLARAAPDAPARVRHVRPSEHLAAGGDPRRRGRLDRPGDRRRRRSAARCGSSPACTASAS